MRRSHAVSTLYLVCEYVILSHISFVGVAFPAKMLLAHSNIIYKDTWAFQKVFGYDDFFASGFVSIQAGGQKSAKNTIDNAYVGITIKLVL